MTVPSGGWDPTVPAGSRKINLGDDDIREFKAQYQEITAVNHKCATGTDADNGKHTKVSLLEVADLGTGAEGKPILGAQTVGGKAELVFTDEDDNDIQITSGGVLKPSTDTTLANWSTVMELVYPVGSQYVNYTDSTNPGTLLGVGTWVAVTEKVTVGVGGAGIFSTLTTGGSKTVDLSHTHTINKAGWGRAATSTDGTLASGQTAEASDIVTSPTTDSKLSATTSIVQEFRTAYVWERTV